MVPSNDSNGNEQPFNPDNTLEGLRSGIHKVCDYQDESGMPNSLKHHTEKG